MTARESFFFFFKFLLIFCLIGFGGDDLYPELWKLCSGPLVEIPRIDERVFYFPQGHMEQVIIFF